MTRSLFVLLFGWTAAAQGPYVLDLVAGSGRVDSAPATATSLDGPAGLAQDSQGNVYIAESKAGIIRRVRPDGTSERFAGSGVIGDGAEGARALETNLSAPAHLLIDLDGGLIFADVQVCRIRKVRKDGVIENLVGTGSCTASSGGGPGGGFGGSGNRNRVARETVFSGIGGLALDASGLLIFTEQNANVVRRLGSDGYARIIAGTGAAGFYGDSADALYASLRAPAGLAYDGRGNLYIGDGTNCRVRRIDADGIITTVAGTSTCATTSTSFTPGPATARSLGRIGALAYDPVSDSLYIASPSIFRVVRLAVADARVSAFLGNGRLGNTDATDPLAMNINEASAILVAADGGVAVASSNSFQVYAVKDGEVRPSAGKWPQVSQYPAAQATELVRPNGLALTQDSLLIVDSGAGRILRYQAPDVISAVAGARYPSGYSQGDNGPALEAALREPARVLVAPSGEIYFTELSRIRVIDSDGVIRTLIDFLDVPAGLAFDPNGNLAYSESGSHRIVLYDFSTKTKKVIAGTGTAGFSGDAGAATSALLNSPGDLVYDSQGNLLIADRVNRRIRRITPDGIIHTVAGSSRGFSYDDISGQTGTDVGLGEIQGMALDASDNLYIAEAQRITVMNTAGSMSILAGFVAEDDNGKRTYRNGELNGTAGIAVDSTGNVYFSLPQEGRVARASSQPSIH
jgi:sugar lactone lactonase YvrE